MYPNSTSRFLSSRLDQNWYRDQIPLIFLFSPYDKLLALLDGGEKQMNFDLLIDT